MGPVEVGAAVRPDYLYAGPLAEAQKMAQEKNPPGQLLFDPDGASEKALGVQMLPTHLVFDKDGKIVLTAKALSDGVEPAIEALVSRGGRREKPK